VSGLFFYEISFSKASSREVLLVIALIVAEIAGAHETTSIFGFHA
jgi:hypothetical protein